LTQGWIFLTSSAGLSAVPTAISNREPAFFSQQVRRANRFYLSLKSGRKKALSVLCGGYEECASDYAIHREAFPFLTLEYVLAGKGRVRLGGREGALAAGVVFTYGPTTPHEILADPSDPPRKYFVNFTGQRAFTLLRSCGLSPGTFCGISRATRVQHLFDELIEHGARGGRLAAELCNALFKYLVLRVSSTATSGDEHRSPAYMTYIRCRDHIERHFTRLQTLQQIASETGLDGAYLCRLFKRFDHQSPYNTLVRFKMNEAAEQLRTTDLLIKDVAASQGYADAFHFSRVFKAAFGISPQEFRRLKF
jgi:AraC-like DNA-binding protein